MNYSIIVPFYNEEKNISDFLKNLFLELNKLKRQKKKIEIIFIDDFSSDKTFLELNKNLSNKFEIKTIRNERNLSQSGSILKGIKVSKYNNIITLDGDGQNDPADIIKLIKQFEKGFDMVIGWRKYRKDKFFTKKLPSYFANYLVRKFTSSNLNDHGCALKVFNKKKLDEHNNWGDFHRLIAARFIYSGYKVSEVVVNHKKRVHGNSSYGFSRIFLVLIDLLYMGIFNNNKIKSIYLFGFLSLFSFLTSFIVMIYLLILKFFYSVSFISTPLPILFVFLFISALIFLFIGLINQIIIKDK